MNMSDLKEIESSQKLFNPHSISMSGSKIEEFIKSITRICSQKKTLTSEKIIIV